MKSLFLRSATVKLDGKQKNKRSESSGPEKKEKELVAIQVPSDHDPSLTSDTTESTSDDDMDSNSGFDMSLYGDLSESEPSATSDPTPSDSSESTSEYNNVFFTYEDDAPEGFGDDVYEKDNSIKDYDRYNFDIENVISQKEARTMIEEKRPFIVSKVGERKVLEYKDIVYHTTPKMKINTMGNKGIVRLGYILADQQPKKIKVKRDLKKYKGIVENEFMILKKRPINTKKIGYLKLDESTDSEDIYVEVVTSRGIKWMLALCGILGVLCLVGFTMKNNDWHMNINGLTIYKTEERIDYTESELKISLNATPVLKDGKVNLKLTSEKVDGISYIPTIYDEKNRILWEGEELQAGDGVDFITPEVELGVGEYDCTLKCESYRNGSFLGIVESDFVLKVRD